MPLKALPPVKMTWRRVPATSPKGVRWRGGGGDVSMLGGPFYDYAACTCVNVIVHTWRCLSCGVGVVVWSMRGNMRYSLTSLLSPQEREEMRLLAFALC